MLTKSRPPPALKRLTRNCSTMSITALTAAVNWCAMKAASVARNAAGANAVKGLQRPKSFALFVVANVAENLKGEIY